MLHDVTTGVIYRNPQAHLRSIHAYFPSCVQLDSGDLVASFSLGEAFESVDNQLYLSRSGDLGATWSEPTIVSNSIVGNPVSEFGRISYIDSQAVLLLYRLDRTGHEQEGLANAQLGFVPTQFLVTKASNDTLTEWTEPIPISPAIEGPCFELCCPITKIDDGRWIIPTSTWPSWDGSLPNGLRMLSLASRDQGSTWPEWLDIFHHPDAPRYFWESKVIQLSSGDLLANAWVHDPVNDVDLVNQYALSRDNGATWTKPRSMELYGQTMTVCETVDGRLLSIYRRMDKPGLWAQLSRLEDDRWVNEAAQPLWGHTEDDLAKLEDSLVTHFRTLRFGAPHILPLANGEFFVSFWCYEDCVSVIRWFRFRL